MLYITLGYNYKEFAVHPAEFFDYECKPEWFNDKYVLRALDEIDKVMHLGGYSLCRKNDPNNTIINHTGLSNGCKSLILARMCPDLKICGDRMGDNCYPILLDMAEEQDIHISLCHNVRFDRDFTAYVTNIDKVVHGAVELRKVKWECQDTGRVEYVFPED